MSIPINIATIASSDSAFPYTLSAGTGGDLSALDGSAPFNTYVGIRFTTGGSVQGTQSTDGGPSWVVSLGNWYTGALDGVAADYEVRYTNKILVSGVGTFNTEAAAEDTWINLGATREWYANRSVGGFSQWTADFQVRKITGGPGTKTKTYGFTVDNVI